MKGVIHHYLSSLKDLGYNAVPQHKDSYFEFIEFVSFIPTHAHTHTHTHTHPIPKEHIIPWVKHTHHNHVLPSQTEKGDIPMLSLWDPF